MRLSLFCLLYISVLTGVSQTTDSSSVAIKSGFPGKLKEGDSVIYYQCHVEEAIQQLSTVTGQTLTGKQQKYTITEKYVIRLSEGKYYTDYYSSSMVIFPNRRFSGLKIREKPYWEFKKEKSFILTATDLKVLLSLESKGREAMEYDYPVSKYTTNQLIIKSDKNFKQLVIEGNYILSKLIGK